jgi:xanthine dehydrogenase YagS FAD-binding subunit
VALGGVAHKPWRDRNAEKSLRGKPTTVAAFRQFADDVLTEAEGRGQNDFKIELAHRALVRALQQATAGTPQDQSDKSVR